VKKINLSYIIATRNRLPFLVITLNKLIDELQHGEEIVVVDGNSDDGSKDYLLQLYSQGKIHQLISEPDHNQAHAWNKAMLMANGPIIKKIIDDDVYDLSAIRKCHKYMMANSAIDVCVSNHLEGRLTQPGNIGITGRLSEFIRWKNGMEKTFTFSDVSMLLRKSSLSYLGLYDTQFKMMDWEYSLRITYLGAGIAYYTGYNALAVGTPGNVTSTASKQLLMLEERIGKIKYNYSGDGADISLYSHIKIRLGKIRHCLLNPDDPAIRSKVLPAESELKNIYSSYYQKLAEYNDKEGFEFIS